MIKRFLKRNGCALWIGGATSAFFDFNFLTWQWWAFCIPAIFLVSWRGYDE